MKLLIFVPLTIPYILNMDSVSHLSTDQLKLLFSSLYLHSHHQPPPSILPQSLYPHWTSFPHLSIHRQCDLQWVLCQSVQQHLPHLLKGPFCALKNEGAKNVNATPANYLKDVLHRSPSLMFNGGSNYMFTIHPNALLLCTNHQTLKRTYSRDIG